jgi:hypothetical protein
MTSTSLLFSFVFSGVRLYLILLRTTTKISFRRTHIDDIMLIIALVAILLSSAIGITSSAFITKPIVVTASNSKHTTTQLSFGIPSFLTPPTPNSDDDKKKKGTNKNESKQVDEEKSVGLRGLVQLIMAGAGAPFLGDFEGVDKETGKFMFSLEANNLVDENGNSKQTAMPYFENGWVDPKDLEREEERKKNGSGFKFPW